MCPTFALLHRDLSSNLYLCCKRGHHRSGKPENREEEWRAVFLTLSCCALSVFIILCYRISSSQPTKTTQLHKTELARMRSLCLKTRCHCFDPAQRLCEKSPDIENLF